jgi:hypothetical protein
MNFREKVVVPGVPFIWSTNLSDGEVREFYAKHSDLIQEPEPPSEAEPGVIRMSLRFAFLDFLDGVCVWTADKDHHTVLYRSAKDWELWNARQNEIAELRQEQDAQRAVQRQLLEVEDKHLVDRTEAALTAGNCDTAAGFVYQRMELRLRFTDRREVPSLWDHWRSQFQYVFARFPSSRHGVEFLLSHDTTAQAFRNFAHSFAAHRHFKGQECAEQTKLIYEEAMKLYPDHGPLAKEACLFWRRMGCYDLAMKICAEAVSKGLPDGTKSGFEGRMLRLAKESKQIARAGRPLADGLRESRCDPDSGARAGKRPDEPGV